MNSPTQSTGSAADGSPAIAGTSSAEDKLTTAKNAWRWELLTVDFRHAFWALLANLIAVVLFLQGAAYTAEKEVPAEILGWAWIVIGLAAPAVIVARLFSTDFAHRTDERLLVCPVPRRQIWRSRLALSAAMVLVPPVAAFMLLPIFGIKADNGESAILPLSVMGIYVAWCAWSFGPLVALMLRRPILVFSATVITPFAVALLLAVVAGLTNLQAVMIPTPDRFPYMPIGLLLMAFILGIASQIIAAHMWRMLEVR